MLLSPFLLLELQTLPLCLAPKSLGLEFHLEKVYKSMLEPVSQGACLVQSLYFRQPVNTVGRKQEPKELVDSLDNLILDGLVLPP